MWAEIESKSTTVGGPVVLALVNELSASLVVAKDLIAQIQARDNRADTFVELAAAAGYRRRSSEGCDPARGDAHAGSCRLASSYSSSNASELDNAAPGSLRYGTNHCEAAWTQVDGLSVAWQRDSSWRCVCLEETAMDTAGQRTQVL